MHTSTTMVKTFSFYYLPTLVFGALGEMALIIGLSALLFAQVAHPHAAEITLTGVVLLGSVIARLWTRNRWAITCMWAAGLMLMGGIAYMMLSIH